MSAPSVRYLDACEKLLACVRAQQPQIEKAADWFAETILRGQMVHVFASGHSRIMVEEMWPRYGSFPGWNPIVELSLTFHNLVVGANGQRQAMFLENVSGFAARILRNFDLKDGDSAFVISSSGCNVVPVEIAEEFNKRGIKEGRPIRGPERCEIAAILRIEPQVGQPVDHGGEPRGDRVAAPKRMLAEVQVKGRFVVAATRLPVPVDHRQLIEVAQKRE